MQKMSEKKAHKQSKVCKCLQDGVVLKIAPRIFLWIVSHFGGRSYTKSEEYTITLNF